MKEITFGEMVIGSPLYIYNPRTPRVGISLITYIDKNTGKNVSLHYSVEDEEWTCTVTSGAVQAEICSYEEDDFMLFSDRQALLDYLAEAISALTWIHRDNK
jgi:hypothetical protein